MSFYSSRQLRFLLFSAGILCSPAYADWAIGASLNMVRPAPEGDQVQGQNPPSFTWAQKFINGKPASGYEVEVTGENGKARRFAVTRNWLLPDAPFSSDSYTWRVRAKEDTVWTDPRKFRIDAAASLPFIVPNEAAVKRVIRARPPVRSLPGELATNPFLPLPPERMKLRATLQNDVTVNTGKLPIPLDARWPHRYSNPRTPEYIAQTVEIRHAIGALARQLEVAALLWRVRSTDTAAVAAANRAEAIKRGNELAALDPEGPTSYVNQDQATRVIALNLIKAVDLLGADLDDTTRARWLKSAEQRSAVIYASISGNNGRLDQYPFNSHGSTNYGMLSAIATLALDRIPAAETWFDYAFRGYANSISPWGGADGGYANGTAYGEYSADGFAQTWLPIAAASGVNLFAKPWSINFAQFMAHFDPAGSPTHVFGDEHEIVPVPYLLKSYAQLVPSPVAAWYAQTLGERVNALTGLQAPLTPPGAIVPAPPADAAQYPSIGWVAMHSKITDPADKRTSVYFKSSPYGSYNHSHADQNSLVINSGGRQLLIEAGKGDSFASAQAGAWYRQTRAHNAVTYDGGVGQQLGLEDGAQSLGWNGAISDFRTTPTLDSVTGTATAAYGSTITSAVRRVWYLRGKDVVIVRDKLSSAVPRIFEWNMHAVSNMDLSGDGVVRIVNQNASLCLRPMTQGGFVYFDAPNIAAGPKQVHGAFQTPAAVKNAEFLMVIDIGCKNRPVTLGGSRELPVLTVDGQQVPLN
ncbi:MAG TPA: heparinase II/III family protein [Telluria sp.]|jgi:hypothetical protein